MAGPRQDTGSAAAPATAARRTTRRATSGQASGTRRLTAKPNLRRVVIGAILVGTVVLLGSMGGAILAAPVVLPLLWWAARTTGRGSAWSVRS
jgi:fatty acid desaturase